jgi:hypothetical protein
MSQNADVIRFDPSRRRTVQPQESAEPSEPWAPPDRQTLTGPRRDEQYRNVLRAMQAAGLPLTDRQREALGDEDHHDEGEAR